VLLPKGVRGFGQHAGARLIFRAREQIGVELPAILKR
jgi:hypothetical protein